MERAEPEKITGLMVALAEALEETTAAALITAEIALRPEDTAQTAAKLGKVLAKVGAAEAALWDQAQKIPTTRPTGTVALEGLVFFSKIGLTRPQRGLRADTQAAVAEVPAAGRALGLEALEAAVMVVLALYQAQTP